MPRASIAAQIVCRVHARYSSRSASIIRRAITANVGCGGAPNSDSMTIVSVTVRPSC